MPTDRASPRDRVEFVGIRFDRLSIDQVIAQLRCKTAQDPFSYLVTPNVDHVVRSEHSTHHGDAALRSIYAAAKWCLCDSRVLAGLARLRGVELPVVPGSDLTVQVCSQLLDDGDVVAVLGGTSRTIEGLRARYPAVRFAHHAPPMGLRDDAAALAAAAAFAIASGARFIFLAVGAPQQELLAREIARSQEARGTALCIGASIDFIVGDQRRAPLMVQKLGLEWAHRLASNPRRLWRRYLVEGPRIFMMVARWRASSDSTRHAVD